MSLLASEVGGWCPWLGLLVAGLVDRALELACAREASWEAGPMALDASCGLAADSSC